MPALQPLRRSISLQYLVPAKKEEQDKEKDSDEDADAEEKPSVEKRLDDAVRDAKVSLLKVRFTFASCLGAGVSSAGESSSTHLDSFRTPA